LAPGGTDRELASDTVARSNEKGRRGKQFPLLFFWAAFVRRRAALAGGGSVRPDAPNVCEDVEVIDGDERDLALKRGTHPG